MQNKHDREHDDEHRRWRDERNPSPSAGDEAQRYGRGTRGDRFGEPLAPEHSRGPSPREGRYSAGRDYSARGDVSSGRGEARDTSEYRYWSGREDSGYRPSYDRYPRGEQRFGDRPEEGRGFHHEYPRAGYQGMSPTEPRGERWASDSSSTWRESDRQRAFSPSVAAERYQRLTGHAGKGPKGYVRSDERIREDVCDRLSDDDELDASEVSVSVKEGEVVLEGTVSDRYSKHRAEDIVESVSGVRDVSNHLRTRKNFIQELGDKLLGDDEVEHHGHSGSGTRNAPSGPPQSSRSH